MRIGIGTNLLDRNGYGRFGDKMYEKLKEHGYSCTDYSMSDTETMLYTMPWNEAESYLIREKELARNAGIEIWQVHGPWRWPPLDETVEGRAERMDKMKKSLRMTSVLECRNWVVHPIMPFGIHDKGTPNASETWELNVEFMGELLKEAKKYDITICLENMPMPEFSIATPREIEKLVDTINDDKFRICLDTGHVSVFGNLSLGDEVRVLKNKIRVLHVHDNKFGIDAHLMPHQGVIDWKDFASSLRETGFDGVFSLETKPPAALSTPIFEEMSKLYFKVADEIIHTSQA